MAGMGTSGSMVRGMLGSMARAQLGRGSYRPRVALNAMVSVWDTEWSMPEYTTVHLLETPTHTGPRVEYSRVHYEPTPSHKHSHKHCDPNAITLTQTTTRKWYILNGLCCDILGLIHWT